MGRVDTVLKELEQRAAARGRQREIEGFEKRVKKKSKKLKRARRKQRVENIFDGYGVTDAASRAKSVASTAASAGSTAIDTTAKGAKKLDGLTSLSDAPMSGSRTGGSRQRSMNPLESVSGERSGGPNLSFDVGGGGSRGGSKSKKGRDFDDFNDLFRM